MSVTETNELRALRGKVTADGNNTYTTMHRVKTDSVTDGVQVVAAPIGTPGATTYSFGGETDTNAVLQSVAPIRNVEKVLHWDVTSEWGPVSTEDPDSGVDENGNQTNDPTLWADEIRINDGFESVPVWEADYMGPHAMDHIGREIGSRGPIVNSAGVLVYPPIQKLEPIVRFSIRQYGAAFPHAREQFRGKVNSVAFGYNNDFLNFGSVWAPKTARCDSVNGTWGFKNGIFYWQWEIVLSENPRTWRMFIPDSGTERFFDADVDPEEGGELAGKYGPSVIAARDAYGFQLPAPMLMDGFGFFLDPSQPPKMLEWRIYEETPFTGLLG